MIKPHKLITSPQNFICLATVLKRINEFIDYPVFREVTSQYSRKGGERGISPLSRYVWMMSQAQKKPIEEQLSGKNNNGKYFC
jgi:hypothetical protein